MKVRIPMQTRPYNSTFDKTAMFCRRLLWLVHASLHAHIRSVYTISISYYFILWRICRGSDHVIEDFHNYLHAMYMCSACIRFFIYILKELVTMHYIFFPIIVHVACSGSNECLWL